VAIAFSSGAVTGVFFKDMDKQHNRESMTHEIYEKGFSVKNALGSVLVAVLITGSMTVYGQNGSSSASTSHPSKSQRAADRALSKQVRSALIAAKIVDVPTIVVRARSGQIALEGYVREQSEVEKAGQVAGTVPGVISVQNFLTLRQPGQ
jgi:hyperosmotically inducible periplasmic protein